MIREWVLGIPEIVNVSVNTPYPGTETWVTETRRFASRDYRLFDIQHAVLPTRLSLPRFYEELVRTQQVLNRKHRGVRRPGGQGAARPSRGWARRPDSRRSTRPDHRPSKRVP